MSDKLVAVEDIHSLKAAQRKAFVVTVAPQDDIASIKFSALEVSSTSGLQVEIIVSSNYDQLIEVLSKCKVKGLD